jgi:putative transcriptional regulator
VNWQREPLGGVDRGDHGGYADGEEGHFRRVDGRRGCMKSHREGKLTLRSYKVAAAPLPKVDSKLIRDTRKRLRCSRAVFARRLRINERTLEKWEQGRAKPNPQAAALVLLVRKYPDTLARLDEVAAR